MCELLVRVVDKTNPKNPTLDAGLGKRGDVIVIMPDGWKWGREELASPEWRIVKIPGADVRDFEDLIGPQMSSARRPGGEALLLRKRAAHIDLDALADPRLDWTGLRSADAATLDAAAVRAAKVVRTPLADPTDIGGADTNVIG